MNRRVVISGVGFVHPAGVGSSGRDLDFCSVGDFDVVPLGGGKRLFYQSGPEISHLPDYPDRKMRRSMRPDAICAYIAALLAVEDSGIGDLDHSSTSLHAGVGQSYADMWPYIRKGIDASVVDGEFDMSRFSKRGFLRIYPFFSIRALPALPLALIAERFGIRGENCVQSSFGAESVVALQHGVRDIMSGRTSLVLVGGADCVSNPHTIENLYFNDFYEGDFYGSTSACFVVLEELEHNERRHAKAYGEVLHCEIENLPVSMGNEIDRRKDLFAGLCPDEYRDDVGRVITNASGTKENFAVETKASQRLFPAAEHMSYFDSCGGLLAAAEPFGTMLLAASMERPEAGISLSRSVCGSESSVVVSKAEHHE